MLFNEPIESVETDLLTTATDVEQAGPNEEMENEDESGENEADEEDAEEAEEESDDQEGN